MEITYKKAQVGDIPACAALFAQLYNAGQMDMEEELSGIVGTPGSIVFLAAYDGTAVGCAHCSLRTDYVEGTDSTPVGYLEGVFVLEQYRRNGLARQLVRHCEAWAKSRGCREFASDCLLDNTSSQAFHQKIGFSEANRIVCYQKPL